MPWQKKFFSLASSRYSEEKRRNEAKWLALSSFNPHWWTWTLLFFLHSIMVGVGVVVFECGRGCSLLLWSCKKRQNRDMNKHTSGRELLKKPCACEANFEVRPNTAPIAIMMGHYNYCYISENCVHHQFIYTFISFLLFTLIPFCQRHPKPNNWVARCVLVMGSFH